MTKFKKLFEAEKIKEDSKIVFEVDGKYKNGTVVYIGKKTIKVEDAKGIEYVIDTKNVSQTWLGLKAFEDTM